jgi:hypothetical protein
MIDSLKIQFWHWHVWNLTRSSIQQLYKTLSSFQRLFIRLDTINGWGVMPDCWNSALSSFGVVWEIWTFDLKKRNLGKLSILTMYMTFSAFRRIFTHPHPTNGSGVMITTSRGVLLKISSGQTKSSGQVRTLRLLSKGIWKNSVQGS